MPVYLLLISSLSVVFADNFTLELDTNNGKPFLSINVENEIINGIEREDFSSVQAWKAREALINSTKFKDGKCITVGLNLQQKDLTLFQSLNSQLMYIDSDKIPSLRKLVYNFWCVR